ncbi:polysaccharide pyruvyl transferase family protein [Vibrio sp. MarTm2]|uniref:polysaccharide pyruvyl transferase family protein n=1 Tax=Vibrio sp. MarTm2 TaxID=2998831 RepID=UPI0022CD2A11|nr:polysaccharide pyruvyl transferase family protein [Vibrio sp. MarTm2]MDA0129862.1 polysaccharide pyruvyl transferase family protein [Vibrio sp. MarTm2]
MIVEIKGVQFVNKGAELMLCAILQQLKARNDTIKIALAPHVNSPYLSRISVGAYQKLSLRKGVFDLNRLAFTLPKSVRKWFKNNWGIVTEADIDVVLDASGFAYGDQWKNMNVDHLYGELIRAKRYNSKYIFMPQAMGPFTVESDRKKLKASLPFASLVFAREKTTHDYIRSLAYGDENLFIAPDFTNLVIGEVPSYFTDGSEKVVIIPNSNMIGDNNPNKMWKDTYLTVLCDAVRVIKSMQLKPVLLNHEGKGDGRLCAQINEQFNNQLEYIEESDPLKVKGIIGNSKAVVCSRFHGCVSALSQSVPCVGTSWSHKYEQLFSEYTADKQLLNAGASYDDIKNALLFSIDNVTSTQYSTQVELYKSQTRDMWSKLNNVLDGVEGE